MNTIELLSPVGDFECLKAAVQSGADCVYFGANLFNARASANNFDDDELKRAIEYAKLRNVKTNLTLNILIKNDEFYQALNLAKKAYEYYLSSSIVEYVEPDTIYSSQEEEIDVIIPDDEATEFDDATAAAIQWLSDKIGFSDIKESEF